MLSDTFQFQLGKCLARPPRKSFCQRSPLPPNPHCNTTIDHVKWPERHGLNAEITLYDTLQQLPQAVASNSTPKPAQLHRNIEQLSGDGI